MLINHVREGLYGDSNRHKGVTMEQCQRTISHVHIFINQFMEDDEKFRGSIDNITSSPSMAPIDIIRDTWNDIENNDVDVNGILVADEDERY